MTVSDHTRRERSIEHLLSQGVGAARVPPTSAACIDAEALAAWSTGRLQRGATERIEEHLADCERCQAMVATFARTEKLTAVRGAWGQRWQVRWFIPLATAATVAALWVAVPERTVPAGEPIDLSARPAVGAPTPPPASPSPQNPALSSDTASKMRAPDRKTAEDSVATANRAGRPDAPTDDEERRQLRLRAEKPAQPPSTPRPASAAPAAAPAEAEATRRAEPNPAAGAVTMAEQQSFARPVVEVRSPDGQSQWRVVGAQIERSLDRGATWTRAQVSVPAMLTSGHSPAASIAWIVGRAGAVYLTTDGITFNRLPFVEAIDLASVVALDGRQATVAAVDGRRFTTTDGGLTWSPR